MPRACFGKDNKGWRLFSVKGTQALISPSRFFQWHVGLDHFDDIETVFDFVNDAHVRSLLMHSPSHWPGVLMSTGIHLEEQGLGGSHPGRSRVDEPPAALANRIPGAPILSQNSRAAKDRLPLRLNHLAGSLELFGGEIPFSILGKGLALSYGLGQLSFGLLEWDRLHIREYRFDLGRQGLKNLANAPCRVDAAKVILVD